MINILQMKEYGDKEQPPSHIPDVRTRTQSRGGFESLAQQYGLDDMDLGGSPAQTDSQSVDDEFNSYANGLLSPKGTDSLKFWEVHIARFLILLTAGLTNNQNYEGVHCRLFAMSMDYLPIQASAVPCERIFSSSAETDTKRRNRIKPELMEALQMLKCALKKDRLDFTTGWTTAEQLMCDTPQASAAGGDLLSELLKDNAMMSALLAAVCEDEEDVM